MLVHMSQLSPLIKENKSDEAIDQGESILSDSVFQDQPVTSSYSLVINNEESNSFAAFF